MQQSPEEFVGSILKSIVSIPEEILIERQDDEMGVFLKITVAQTDFGAVCGKAGATMQALRRLTKAFGMRTNAFISLKLIDPRGFEHSHV